MSERQLRESPMMGYLLDSLEEGCDIGHFGRLTFTLVARYFLPRPRLVSLLSRNPSFSKARAEALVNQVMAHDYSPPTRETILEWQKKQTFPICPSPGDPLACNVYRELTFPPHVYEEIEKFYNPELVEVGG